LTNRKDIIPLRNLQDLRIAVVDLNRDKSTKFQERLLDYCPADTFTIDPGNEKAAISLMMKLSGYNLVNFLIIAQLIHSPSIRGMKKPPFP